ncbi:hypothetical protein ATO49_19585 [Mycolicibacterium fortuitum subsp. fortuitum DSM 46621 = ATCC 6841 = JCM 6387]|nr:hypothetical protein ATO49_19585 [Mycolicibacterium fortuitum subsp. fortuitum DSM 46621 = ATCC 6841 = JCM 6387]
MLRTIAAMVLSAADERDQRRIGQLDRSVDNVQQPEFDECADIVAGRVHAQHERGRPAPFRGLNSQRVR